VAAGQARNTTPEEEYRKSIKVNEDIQPLGETPFGENISLYDDSLHFSYPDITLKGAGPDIVIERTLRIESFGDLDRLKDNAFGDWDINLPRIDTIVARQQQVDGWMVETVPNKQICRNFGPPPGVNGVLHDNSRHSWQPVDWWHGYQLVAPGAGSQDLLRRGSASPGTPQLDGVTVWPALTKENWQVGCLGTVSDDSTRDAFLGVAPDGTRYWFNTLSYRWAAIITRPLDTFSDVSRSRAGAANGMVHPMAAAEGDDLYREEASMYASQVTDRFGNSVTYTYSTGTHKLLTAITASDGRAVQLTYEAGTPRVSTITTQPGTSLARTWTYHYAIGAFGIPTLTSIVQPDGSQWTFDMARISAQSGPNFSNVNGALCSAISAPNNEQEFDGSITHPSGLTGTFKVRPAKRGRANVWKLCQGYQSDPEVGHAKFPNAWYVTALQSRTFTGAGIGTLKWSYQPSPANESWYGSCPGECPSEVWTDVIAPDFTRLRSVFSNNYYSSNPAISATESRLLRTEQYRPNGDGTEFLVRKEETGYASATQGPWPQFLGEELQHNVNDLQTTRWTPPNRTTITQDGNWFQTDTTEFDAFAQPVRRVETNNVIDPLGQPMPARDQRTLLFNDLPHWVLGLPATTSLFRNNAWEEVSRYVYTSGNPVLAERWRFGALAMRYAFWTDGRLQSFADGRCGASTPYANCVKTVLDSYVRDIPTIVTRADGNKDKIAVDAQGQVASITNPLGAQTSYAYDAMGRVSQVTYPSGDSTAWAPKVFRFEWVASPERGVAGNHWRRTVTEGNRSSVVYFDALLRPLVTTSSGDGAPSVSVGSGFDWKGRKVFDGYPTGGLGDVGDLTKGTTTAYDALDRVISVTQDAEPDQPNAKVASSTAYGANTLRRVTDPRGAATDTWFQVFGAPSYGTPTRVAAPEGIVQTIKRDIYGNPLEIEQGGVIKRMAYDAAHRLCRTTEPESMSQIVAYDGADNLVWSASGIDFQGTDCGQTSVAEGDKTARSYDAMNRLKSVVAPVGTLAETYDYDAAGNPSATRLGDVTWTYGRNLRGLLTAEVMAIDTWIWPFQYDYDSKAALKSLTYPDGEVVGFNPNGLGQPRSAGAYAMAAEYYPDGDLQSFAFGSGATYTSDKNDRKLPLFFAYGRSGAPQVSEDFRYDANGNIREIHDIVGSQRSKHLEYDSLNRLSLAQASGLWGLERYGYDTLNNLRNVCAGGVAGDNCSGGTANVYGYDGSNRLVTIKVGASTIHNYGYDARGNTTIRDNQSLAFDRANRLQGFNGLPMYFYDAAGRRAKKVTPSGTTYYAYNGSGQLLWEMDPATKLGSDYIYLGKKLIAKKTANIEVLPPAQVQTVLSIVGLPKLAINGSTIDITLDIANNGTRPLTGGAGQYGVQMGYHLIHVVNGAATQPEAPVPLSGTIAPGAHGTITMRVAATAVLGQDKRIRFSLVQPASGWFENWPGNTVAEAGPYSACPVSGTGNLCNNVTGLTRDQVAVAMTITSPPTLSVDGTSVLTTVDIANNGKVTLASMAPHAVDLGNHIIDSSGGMVAGDVTRVAIPDIAPGQHAAVAISTPANLLLGLNRRVQFDLVQEGIAWFQSFGVTPITAGPYVTLSGPANSTTGSFTMSWQGIAGATAYSVREQFNGGTWTSVSSSAGTSWAASGRGTGTYNYQVQACSGGACAPFGSSLTVNVLLPPPVPAAISATAPIAGPISVSWTASATAARYVVSQQFNGGAWGALPGYDGAATAWSYSPSSTGSYVYQVQACNSSGCSATRQSGAVAITQPPATAPSIGGGGTSTTGAYTISWAGVGGAASYSLMESANGGGWTTVQNTAAASWSTSGRGNGTYVYQVQACNAGGCGPFSGQASVRVALPPLTPSGVAASRPAPANKRRYEIHWNTVADVTNYQVERTIPGTGTDIQDALTTPSLTFIEDTGLSAAQISMRVRACNASGCSPWSGYVYVNF
jgi:YD repeat-containing protein